VLLAVANLARSAHFLFSAIAAKTIGGDNYLGQFALAMTINEVFFRSVNRCFTLGMKAQLPEKNLQLMNIDSSRRVLFRQMVVHSGVFVLLAIVFESLCGYILQWWGYPQTSTVEAVLLIRLFIPGQWLLLLAMNYMVFSTEHHHPSHETGAQVAGIVIHVIALILFCFIGNLGMTGIGLATISGHLSRLVYLWVAHAQVQEWRDADKRRACFDLELKEKALPTLRHCMKAVLLTISNYWMIDFILLFAVILSPHVS